MRMDARRMAPPGIAGIGSGPHRSPIAHRPARRHCRALVVSWNGGMRRATDMDHALTVRLPDQVYRAARNMADRRGISINRLVQEAIAEIAEKSVEERLRRAYDVLALDPAAAEVETSFAIQAEALLGE